MANRRIGGAGGGSDPGPGKGKAGVFVAAAVSAGLVAAAGSGAGGTLLGSSGGTASGSSGGASAGKSVSARKAEGKKAARRGNADEAWDRMGMRRIKQAVRQDLDCLRHSFGQVQQFFVRTPCTSLDRVVLAVGDGGNTVVVSVVWVSFRDRGDVRRFRDVMDVHGSGDIKPLGSALLGMADIRFTGHHYHAHSNGRTVAIAETERVSGRVSDEMLGAMAEVAALLPRP
ncbi:hypothetical protein [Streptoalloteichus hindustanus]|uniref:Uncharacterized protein n=1 Tax=Streptoalloteichus hindustanus TaxID=2017 RepID=A0A1M5HG87_STRHI|nr:hypothetical protein [Streptoalloteichus hindustanus]SHG14965.1 hypothetical protein SAMN05444320_106548 [Streptoalloteichus hindustanus]